ncbi:MAG: glycosyltransferase family 9 protein [Nitrospinales bacterium]
MANRILVMNLTRMGDLVQSTPLISGLRKKHPDASITLMVCKEFESFASRIPFVDDVIVYDVLQFNRMKEQGETVTWDVIYRYLEDLLRGVMERQFDLIFNLSHSRLSALMITYMGHGNVRGFFCNKTGDRMTHQPWLQYFGIEPFNRAYNSFNLADIYLRSGEVESQFDRVMIKTGLDDFVAAEEIMRRENIHDDDFLIGFQAGSSLEGRRWPTRSFAELGDMLAANLNAKIVLFGVESESAQAREILALSKMKSRFVDLTGKTSISQLIGLLKRCRYLVTNDTGTMHIAAAVGTRVVGLFFAHAHPHETGPYGDGHLVFQARIPCAPCSYGVECNNIVCVQKVRPADVYSLMQSHIAHGVWKAPEITPPLDEVHIVQSGFDPNGFLRFAPLIKRPVTRQGILILAYREMWIVSLTWNDSARFSAPQNIGLLVQTLKDDFDVEAVDSVLGDLRHDLALFRELMQISREGVRTGEEIRKTTLRKKFDSAKIKALGQKISELDERINLLGMGHPQVKPLTDMFNKRKENLDGDDVSRLAGETVHCYTRLGCESARMVEILAGVAESFGGSRSAGFHAGLNSIKAAVPGK